MLLRPAEAADVADLAAVQVAARAAAPMPANVRPEAEIEALLAGRSGIDEVWVAELDGEVAAYARFTPTWLDDLYVHPAHQGEGIGTALLDLVLSLRPGGLGLYVFETNVPAQRFYAAHGFVVTERSDGSGRLATIPGVVPGVYDRPTGCLFSPRCAYATDHARAIRPALEAWHGGRVRCHYPLGDPTRSARIAADRAAGPVEGAVP